jgi:hypothetical protein
MDATPEEYPELWGPARFGDPCRECGLDWSFDPAGAVELMGGMPDRYAAIVGDHPGDLRHPDLAWSLGAYVCHVADNVHIWAQWLAGAALHGEVAVPGYEEQLLAEARYYNQVPVQGALWQLRQAVSSWGPAVELALQRGIVLQHQTRGPHPAGDVVRSNAHDAYHHAWDLTRIIAWNAT